MASRRALIVGSRGQDGRLLSELLGRKGYAWLGVARGAVDDHGTGWTRPVDITDPAATARVVDAVRPDEVYHLAAHHHAAEAAAAEGSAHALRLSFEVNVLSLGYLLDAIRRLCPATRLFYAASSHVFGDPAGEPQSEQTPLAPTTTYGVAKAAGTMLCRSYRREHGVFAAAGILYNHESAYRPPHYVSSRIVDGALAVQRGEKTELVLARLDAEADWGWAPEYVDAMHRVLQLDAPDDFVVATGRKHSVRDFATAAFDALGLDWRTHVREDRGLAVRTHRGLVGDARRLAEATGWRAQVTLPEMVRLLVRGRAGTAEGP